MDRAASFLRTRPPVGEEGEEVGDADDPPTLSTAMHQALAEYEALQKRDAL